MSSPAPVAVGIHPPTVFFLSDYGLDDEFVGVVHAVLHRIVPAIAVVDLTHGVPPFNVRAGAAALERAVPHLGPGSVLAVVDPGVGGGRRGVAVQSGDGRWFVGPDNGLVVAAAEASGGILAAVTLSKRHDAPPTFDGRDVFAPAAATLAADGDPAGLGVALDPRDLVRVGVAAPLAETGPDGRRLLRTEVTWVDRFGNVQLGAASADGPPMGFDGAGPSTQAAVPEATVRIFELDGGATRDGPVAPGPVAQFRVRRVPTFSALTPGEVGLISDANGRLALVVREGSAAVVTGGVPGAAVELEW